MTIQSRCAQGTEHCNGTEKQGILTQLKFKGADEMD